MNGIDHHALAEALLPSVLEAGRIELGYLKSGVVVERKADASPVTAADREAEAVLVAALGRIAPGIPVVAEEANAEAEAGTAAESALTPPPAVSFFLVDPLDGTRDYIAGLRDFTINVALIVDTQPVFGLIFAPARDELYVTLGEGYGAFARVLCAEPAPRLCDVAFERLATRPPPADGLVALMSPWRPREPVERCLAPFKVREYRTAGSSYKFCLLARGEGDVYPQPGATSEWDTAAGQALVESAGGTVATLDGRPLVYGKREVDYRNPPFLAWGLNRGLTLPTR